VKSGSYLSSARTSSVLALLLVYVSVEQSCSFLRNAGTLQQSREALARAVVQLKVNQSKLAGVIDIDQMSAEHDCPGVSFFESRTVSATRVMVTQSDGRRWRADAFWCRPAQSDPNEPEISLQRISRELHLPFAAGADAADLFNEIEHQLTDERVNIAPLGFTMRGDLTPWVIGPVVVGLLAMIRNCTRGVLEDEEHALDEPWLVVDEGIGLERLIAGLWITSIALAPWVSSASIFAAFAWRVYADGSITTGVTDATLVAVAGGILLSGAWLGITVASDLIALRAARQERRDADARRVEAVEAN